MNLLTIDHIIVYVFLAITLVVGLYYGRGVKTLKSYAVADRSYNAVIISITLIATMIGAGTVIGSLTEVIDSDFLYAFSVLGSVFGITFLSACFAPKFDKRFKDCISMGDVLSKFLGKSETKAACFIMFFECTGILGAQLIVMGHLCKNFLGLSYETSVILTATIIILYSTFGGIKSVTMTDVLQFFVLVIAIPFLATTLLRKTQISSQDISTHFYSMFSNKTKVIDYFALAIFWMIPLNFLNAPLVQRYLMVKSSVKIKLSKVTMGYAWISLLVLLMLLTIAICFLKLQPVSDSSEIMSIILQDYLQSGFRGFALIGIIAVIMSSADSFLNASSVLFVKNILPVSKIKSEKKVLLLTKITTLVIGVTALLMALQNFRAVTLMVYTETLLIAGASIPLMAGLFGFKVNRESFWICLVTAGITYSISKYNLPDFEYIHSLFILITSVSAFFISHYIINKGFAFDPKMKPNRPLRATKKAFCSAKL